MAAIREQAVDRGLGLSTLSRRADLGDLLDRAAADPDVAGELRVSDLAAIARELGVSASVLIARGEELCRGATPRRGI